MSIPLEGSMKKTLTLSIDEISEKAIIEFLVGSGCRYATFRDIGLWTREPNDQDNFAWFCPSPDGWRYAGDCCADALSHIIKDAPFEGRMHILTMLYNNSAKAPIPLFLRGDRVRIVDPDNDLLKYLKQTEATGEVLRVLINEKLRIAIDGSESQDTEGHRAYSDFDMKKVTKL